MSTLINLKRDTTMSPLTLSTSMLENSNSFNNNKNGLLLESSKLKMNIQPTPTTTTTNSNDNISNKLKIRFLIFVEDSDGIRYQIFDSEKNTSTPTTTNTTSSNNKIKLQNNNNNITSPSSTSPISSKLNNETLIRMVFGSFPMVVSNRTAIKVHSLKNSNKTMISNVFLHYNTSSSTKVNNNKCNCNNNNNTIRRDSIVKIKEQVENNNNTQPINIVKTDNKFKKLNISINNVETPTHQSFSSSEMESTTNLSINTNSNYNNNQELLLNQQQQLLNGSSPCSSVPTYYGSYSGIYKRLMRSVSNSLISTATTTNQAIQQPNDFNNLTVNLNTTTNNNNNNNNNDSINELDSTHTTIDNNNTNSSNKIRTKRKTSISITSNSSFSNKNNNSKEYMDDYICEKCIDNQRYPKYKIGIGVIYCLPAAKSPTSPLSPNTQFNNTNTINNNINNHTNNNNNTKSKINKQQSTIFDPLVLFPSLPSLPSSPNSIKTTTTTNENKFDFNQSSSSASNSFNSINDNFYEFFFSHLPIIEYQIKELKEKIIQSLPLYFNPNTSNNIINSNNNGLASSSTRSSFSSSSLCSETNHISNLSKQLNNRLHFNQKMMMDFEEFERRFYALYLSKRIASPAWLTLINNRTKQQDNNKITINNKNRKIINPNTSNVCNNLINDFVYLNKIINPKSIHSSSSSSSSQSNSPATSNNKRFLINLRNAFNSIHSPASYETTNNSKLANTTSSSSFLSILLSTVLKHHLSWVTTVLPSNELDQSNSNHVNLLRKQQANWTSILEKTNPYNPLWAQLGDLHGAINNPLKLVRTVIVGKNKELIERLLFLLSYFIRCSNSSYFDISPEFFDFDKLPAAGTANSAQASTSSSASSASSPNSNNQNNNNNNDNFRSPIKSTLKLNLNEDIGESDELLDFSNTNNNNNSSFLIDNINKTNLTNCLKLDISNTSSSNNNDSKINSREVNVFELSTDPISQLNAVFANVSIVANNNKEKSNKNKKNKKYSKRNDIDQHQQQQQQCMMMMMMSMSSSSSIASPSSCSMSSSPLNTIQKSNHKLQMNNSSSKTNDLVAISSSSRKQRKLSSNSNGENCNAQELPLIGCKLKPNYLKSTRMQDNFGYSLLASYCDEFVFEFVLHGTSDKSFLSDLHERLVFSKQNSIIDCQLQESVYIVVDVDEFDIKVYSSESQSQPIKEKAIPLIDSLVQSVLDMIKLFQNSEFVILHLEDKLQELYTKAITLNELKSQMTNIDDTSLISLMDLNDNTDLDFLNRILTAVFLPNYEN